MSGLLPAFTPRLANSLASRLPASLRATARWNAERMTKTLRALRDELPREQQARHILEVITAGAKLTRIAHEHPNVLQDIMEATGGMMLDAVAMAEEQLGRTIAGVAADFTLRTVRGLFRFIEEHWETLAEDAKIQEFLSGTPIEELMDLGASSMGMDAASGEFLRGQCLGLVLTDALEEGCEPAVLARLAVEAAQGLLRASMDPRMHQFPYPFVNESREQCDERMLLYVRVGPMASSEAEREVMLKLRTVHLQLGSRLAPLVDLATSYYSDTLERLA